MLDDIRSRLLAVAAEPSRLAKSGLLFHGTAEPFDEAPDAVGGDGLLWFARSPLMAQTYIPASGLAAIVGKPFDHRLDERVWPNSGFWTDFAVQDLGYALPDVEYDKTGQAKSWSATMPWPTYRECLHKLAGLGYDFREDPESVKQTLTKEGKFHVMPKAWRKPGRVFVTIDDGLSFADHSVGESDLTEKAHLRFDLFRAAEKRGFGGVIIDDFAQSEDFGNVGHRAYGLFSPAARSRQYLVFEAVHRPLEGTTSHLTEDFVGFVASLAQEPDQVSEAPLIP